MDKRLTVRDIRKRKLTDKEATTFSIPCMLYLTNV